MALYVSRIHKIAWAILFIGTLLIVRLVYLQVLESPKLAIEGLSGRVAEVSLGPERGDIFDRNGILLTNTVQTFCIIIFPAQVVDPYETASQLVAFSGIDENELMKRMRQAQRPFKLQANITEKVAETINQLQIPGVLAVAEKSRYSYSSLAVHTTGYINVADNQGVSGIERMYDDILKGEQTEHVAALVDAGQQIIPGLGYTRLKLGNNLGPGNIILTIDSRIQKIVENIMDKHEIKGAVVIMKPSTGEILAMASRPKFDPTQIENYLTMKTAPFLNRALSAYQPGSIFKLVVAAAALENKVVRPDDIFFDPGYVDVSNRRFYGWDYEQGGRGNITFTDAMAYSSNPAFITVGLKLGSDKLISFARQLGFGQHTQLAFYGEADGNLPDSSQPIYPGELANLAIGQGSFEATPLQFACLVSTILNDGVKVEPYLVSRLVDTRGRSIKSFSPAPGVRVFSHQTAEDMKKMMAAVTRYGTGEEAYVPGVGSAGKTGSAETGRMQQGKSVNHAWFAGYAPLQKPQYAAVVFVEEGHSGGDVAAPIFREIFSEVIANTPSDDK
ncbi:peptidoglycan D,D-transpeptidase FtsI family protein [Propionispora vibrioides]|uniref:Penicillin-binding protein 2 n=1 Tax=Propionispora vibrioides TaxID=112903 RepID=A0A1H8NAD2_9FIRM|nr:penicillin-binding transpeptidase domain-containing protein [Propionispora vibrioides]SEO26522.1 penicillin-binding protein 2 [Propionispora vibrioides]